MDEAVLVEQDAYEGARLVQQLDANGLPLVVVLWAHEPNHDIWRLVIAVPMRRLPSPRAAYEQVQQTIDDLGLSLSLRRVSIIPDSHPLIGTIQALIAGGFDDIVEVPLSGADIGGEPADKAYGYRVEALRYERQISAALEGAYPGGNFRSRPRRLSFDGGFDFVFVLDDELQTVVVEAKALPRPLSNKDIDRLVYVHQRAWEMYRSIAWMLVSKKGFEPETETWTNYPRERLHIIRNIALIKWSDENDDLALQENLRNLLMRGI